MEKIHLERLEQLAKHIVSNKRGHAIFDFSCFNEKQIEHGTDIVDGNICQTNGCAIGEMPILWPNEFMFLDGYIVPIEFNTDMSPDYEDTKILTSDFLGVTEEEWEYLFVPADFKMKAKGLESNATPEEVSEHILKFVEMKRKSLIESNGL